MAARARGGDPFRFNGEDVGVSAAAALRTAQLFARNLPSGRYFSAIASLTELSEAAAAEFEQAGLAELEAETDAAELHLHRGMRLTQRLKEAIGAERAVPLPDFLRRKQ